MHPSLPVLSHFPFIGIDLSVDIYTIIKVDPTDLFSLGISKLLRTFLFRCTATRKELQPRWEILKSSTKDINMYKNQYWTGWICFSKTLWKAPWFVVCFNVFDRDKEVFTTKLLSKNGLIRMLESSDSESIDLVSFFLGFIEDFIFGNSGSSNITNVFTQFVDLHTLICRYRIPHWTKNDLELLRQNVFQVKTTVMAVVGPNQSSRMGTRKWHFLAHFADHIQHIGGVQLPHGELYESSRKVFETFSRRQYKGGDQL